MSVSSQTDFYFDFQQFGDLKRLARGHSGEAAKQVARQFEGLFVQQMMSAMRAAGKVDQNQHSSYMDFYHDLYDKQVAQMVAGEDRLGVSHLIMSQMPEDKPSVSPVDESVSLAPVSAAVAPASEVSGTAVVPDPVIGEPRIESGETTGVVLGQVVDDDFAEVNRYQQHNIRWEQPQNFVADILPEARRAAAVLGTSARVLVAQAALETGWGKHTMKFDDGRNSYNLFGIKADSRWDGAALARNSLEFRDGALQPEVSRFRAYNSTAQSLKDYVDLIRGSARYRQALQMAADDHAYVRELQAAGYATDPNYADKIIDILNGNVLQGSLASIDSGVSTHA